MATATKVHVLIGCDSTTFVAGAAAQAFRKSSSPHRAAGAVRMIRARFTKWYQEV